MFFKINDEPSGMEDNAGELNDKIAYCQLKEHTAPAEQTGASKDERTGVVK